MQADTEVTASKRTIAINTSEFNQWGCPNCGFDGGMGPDDGTSAMHCVECETFMIIVSDGYTLSVSVDDGDGAPYYPAIEMHPRAGKPKHGMKDIKPPEGGEYFTSRGIGVESRVGCFVCGISSGHGYLNNVAAFVASKAGGERVVALFEEYAKGGARLDYRDYEPHRIQVKVGACDDHLLHLGHLHEQCSDGRITPGRIMVAVGARHN